MKYYKCDICGYEHEGDSPPKHCVLCKAPETHFFEYDKESAIDQKQAQLNKTISDNKAKSIACCPKCGSTSIEAVNREFSLLSGFIGSGKTLNYCKNCGHKWDPKKE